MITNLSTNASIPNQFIIIESRSHITIENENSEELIKITKLHGHGSIKAKTSVKKDSSVNSVGMLKSSGNPVGKLKSPGNSVGGPNFSGKKICRIFKSFGVLGLLKMNGKYLISVSNARVVGQIFTHKVFEILDIHVIPVSDGNDPEIAKIKGLVGKGLYFSDFPIFRRMAGGGSAEEFVFNWRLLENFNAIIRGASEGVTVKCICGYFGSISYRDFQVALISRRSWRYAGTRYNRRGASVDGDAANFVETEQIVYDSARKTSFVITRGSIPLLWKQFPAFWYAPKILLTRNSDVLQKHYDKMIERYKNVFFVNLICVKGGEAEICRVFNDEMARIQIKNLHFNFKEKKIAYLAARRDEFFKDIAEKMNTFGFTSDKEQNGVMRINCIDSIDRTNMVQFLICQEILGKQIAHLHLKCAPDETFFQKYEIIWIHNGDALARQYTDTRALKSYALRTPRINIAYMLRDKAVSLERHLKCLFTHGRLQTSHDLLTGNNETLAKSRAKKLSPSMLILLTILAIVIIVMNRNNSRIGISVFLGYVLGLTFGFRFFIDYPDFVISDEEKK